ncbi:MAG: hypothetical protein GY927_18530 [bacterium]|nr:hypothetical protein [bacterium]
MQLLKCRVSSLFGGQQRFFCFVSLDQPAEVIVRGDELIVVNMDMPWPDPHGYLINTKIDQPYTLSVITLD